MASYIRPRVSESERESTVHAPHHKQRRIFSLLAVKIKTEKFTKNNSKTLNFQKQNSSEFNGVFVGSQWFKAESSSLNLLSAIQAQNSSLKATNSVRSRKGEIEKKRERIQGFRTSSGEKEEDYRSNPKFKPRNQRNRIKIQGFWRFRLKISRLNTGNTQTQSHSDKTITSSEATRIHGRFELFGSKP